MTKGELLRWLEPFTNEVEVTILMDDRGRETPIMDVEYVWREPRKSAYVRLRHMGYYLAGRGE